MNYSADATEKFQREYLAELLSQLPQKQVDFFNSIHPPDKFPNGIPASKLPMCIDLAERSIRAEEKKLEATR